MALHGKGGLAGEVIYPSREGSESCTRREQRAHGGCRLYERINFFFFFFFFKKKDKNLGSERRDSMVILTPQLYEL